MMRYSMQINKENVGLAYGYDINASYKDLGAVCDAIRYLKVERAMEVLEQVAAIETPIPFKRFNTHMGARHELGGKKGAYPSKAAKEVRKILVNAVANSRTKGLDVNSLYIVHASANKTHIERRTPSKGSSTWGRGMYGLSARTHSDIEYAKIEIGVGEGSLPSLTQNMKYFIKVRNPVREIKSKPKEKPKAAVAKKPEEAKKQVK